MPSDRFGNRLQAARNLGNLAAPVSIRDGLDRRDQNDVARFELGSRSTVTFQVGGLRRSSAIGVEVFTPKSTSGKAWRRFRGTDLGQVAARNLRQQVNFLSRSRATAGSPDSISLTLDAGEYYLRLYSRKNSTSYRLLASASPMITPAAPPTPPSSFQPPPSAAQPPPSPSPTPTPPPSSTPPPAPNPTPVFRFNRNWMRQFGTSANDYAYGVAVDSSRLFVSGSTNGNLSSANLGDRDSYVAQLTTQGTVSRIEQFGQTGTDVASDVVVDSAGNYYAAWTDVVAGNIPNPNGYIEKFSPAGRQPWQTITSTAELRLGLTPTTIQTADAVSKMTIDAQGNVYVTGFIGGLPLTGGLSQPSRAFVAKYSSSGEQEWLWDLDDSPGSSSGTDIVVDRLGNVYISGIVNATLTADITNPFTNGDPYVAKLNGNGLLAWQDTIAAPGTNMALGIALDSTDSIYITGDTIGALPDQTSTGGSDGFLAKYNPNGARQWIKQFGTAQLDESQAIAIDNQDRIYLSGETNGSLFGNTAIGQSDAWVAAFDSDGTLLGSTQIGTPRNDEAYGLAVVNPEPNAPPNSLPLIYLVGQTQGTFPDSGVSNQGDYDAWAAQYSLSPVE